MSRNPILKRARNNDIKKAYAKLEAETVTAMRGNKVQKYSRQAILAILSRKFYLEPDTLSNILIMPDEVVDKRQMDMFKGEK